jgi:hypothetical protein
VSSGSTLLQTVGTSAVGATVGAIVGGTVSYLYRRLMRRESARLERALYTLEHLLGGTTAAIPIIVQKGTMNPTLAQYRKGVAAGFGVILMGLLTWAESANLEPVLGPLVPEPFRPLVGVLLGGVALTASVIMTSNAPATAATAATVSTGASSAVLQPAYARRGTSSGSGGAVAAAGLASLVAGVAAGTAAAQSQTSLVTLLDPPTRSYQ